MMRERKVVPQISHLIGFHSRLFKHFHPFSECYSYSVVTGWKLEVAGSREDLFHDLCQAFVFFSRLERSDDVDHELFCEGQNFVIVVSYNHFEIKSCELSLCQHVLYTLTRMFSF